MGVCKTIDEPSKGVFKDKRSEFLAFAYHVETEEEVKEIRQKIKKKYHDAKHHVYAVKIGCCENELVKMSDDGEPHNSSAPPVLGQIKAFGLSNILIVVVRYFGGKKLGIPGLINAYKTAAKFAIENANIIEQKDEVVLFVHAAFDKLNLIMKYSKKLDFKVVNVDSTQDGYKIKIAADSSQKNKIAEELEKMGCKIQQ